MENNSTNQANPIISIKNLRKNYGEKQVLKGVNLEIYPGQVIGYIGPNGAGKTTLIRIINQIIEGDSGTILIDGKPLSSDHISQIGIVGNLTYYCGGASH